MRSSPRRCRSLATTSAGAFLAKFALLNFSSILFRSASALRCCFASGPIRQRDRSGGPWARIVRAPTKAMAEMGAAWAGPACGAPRCRQDASDTASRGRGTRHPSTRRFADSTSSLRLAQCRTPADLAHSLDELNHPAHLRLGVRICPDGAGVREGAEHDGLAGRPGVRADTLPNFLADERAAPMQRTQQHFEAIDECDPRSAFRGAAAAVSDCNTAFDSSKYQSQNSCQVNSYSALATVSRR